MGVASSGTRFLPPQADIGIKGIELVSYLTEKKTKCALARNVNGLYSLLHVIRAGTITVSRPVFYTTEYVEFNGILSIYMIIYRRASALGNTHNLISLPGGRREWLRAQWIKITVLNGDCIKNKRIRRFQVR